ncbi:MAG: outer membrane beta-barrel protein [Balneolaceae bacterium]|nr:outer membrane beta-barrel protein [Balneolaceae bacterium]
MKKLICGIFMFAIMIAFTQTATAQWSIGASYEVRNEVPENGFGVRVERGILQSLPLVDLGIRAHFSFFNDENSITSGSQTISGDIQSYDYGVAAIGGVKIAMLKPYVGLGIGSEQFEFDTNDAGASFDESNFYINGFGGLELTLLPLINPFIEYRISNLSGAEDVNYDNVGRVAFGVNLRF